MQAYKLAVPGVVAVVMAEDDDAVIEKVFGHLNEARKLVDDEEPKLIARGGIRRLDGGDDGQGTIIIRIEVWTNEVKFLSPEGSVN